jgi:hypothetical protein
MRRTLSAMAVLVLAAGAVGGERVELPAIKREDLRYDGKSFEQWQRCARTELKPERCVEALEALTVLGTNGYGREAAETIMAVVKGYLPTESRAARGRREGDR